MQETPALISYAQNWEDVMLWRALKHIENGFYIDVGAWSEEHDSVTRAFYDHGWRGINIEPNAEFFSQFQMRRTRDINLCLAVSDKPGSLTMNILRNPGLSTLDDAIAKRHISKGWTAKRKAVEVSTLAVICKQHVPMDQDIHFLKVDVEGSEEAVLRGNDWSKYRPWILVIEATRPMSQDECFESWEPLLLSEGYHFAYADGLNRFYVSRERSELLASFNYPPNVFDNFKQNSLLDAEAKANSLKIEADHLNRELQSIQASFSWRITAPLRVALDLLHRTRRRLSPGLETPAQLSWDKTNRIDSMLLSISRIIMRCIKGLASPIFVALIHFAMAHPALKSRALAMINKYPNLTAWLYRFAAAKGIIAGGSIEDVSSRQPLEPLGLTASSLPIYADLKEAIGRHKDGS